MFQDTEIEQLLNRLHTREWDLIDVRSPSEFADSTIPGSINIPLFTDEERREVGTIYKQVSIQAAKDKGLEIVSQKLPVFIKQFEALGKRPKAVFCWRGGMRSKTTATVLSLMGIRAIRLAGGYRAYRKWVVSKLDSFQLTSKCIVLHGYTGTGKTAILQKLADQGFPVLDLEKMAGHRGSIFGHIGRKPNNQKTFESMLIQELLKYKDAPYVLMEAESKRIGKAVLPDFLMEGKARGDHYMIELPLEVRIRNIINDYEPEEHKELCQEAFQRIKNRIHTPAAQQIESCLQEERYAEAVSLLLEYYYDPRYDFAGHQYSGSCTRIQASSVGEAADKIAEILSNARQKVQMGTEEKV
ncbi:tRNA 2-selenouridine(34) synthase MnmH [Paenibacillus sp. J2TS4]|uniref:tRNA 2-selenouridine(34) synthase MnmH n=1 Tax=Paenibacillus sp. J2TS4 TaxID=2807194 RepID=UPI001B04336D|nr:tRNA 2-selenouridine(34) synthase MnmH [Paenibacillus sp. J2TS4]GIP33788.1 tRNA 2-selenouridine synthase [Paenibacillus sp. J2TS4]